MKSLIEELSFPVYRADRVRGLAARKRAPHEQSSPPADCIPRLEKWSRGRQGFATSQLFRSLKMTGK
jgi:hypothetical protein